MTTTNEITKIDEKKDLCEICNNNIKVGMPKDKCSQCFFSICWDCKYSCHNMPYCENTVCKNCVIHAGKRTPRFYCSRWCKKK